MNSAEKKKNVGTQLLILALGLEVLDGELQVCIQIEKIDYSASKPYWLK